MILFYDITDKTLRTLLVFSVSCLLPNFSVAAEIKSKPIKAPVSGISKTQNPRIISGGAKAETIDKTERHLPATLKHQDRTVSKEDYKNLSNKSPGVIVNTRSLKPKKTAQKQPLKNSKTISKQPRQSNLGYKPLIKEAQAFTTKEIPQWSDQRNHDPGKTLLNSQFGNKQLNKNIKRSPPSFNQPISIKPDSKDYNVSSEPIDIHFGDGKSGRRLPTTTNSKIPSYKIGNKTSTIDTRRGLSSGMDSLPANNNAGMTKTRHNDGVNNIQQSGNLVKKPLATGFTRKPAAGETTKVTGSQTVTKTRTIKADRLIVKAHQTNRQIRTQQLIVKAHVTNKRIRTQTLIVKGI